MSLLPYLRLMRPANIVTAFADILLGFTAAGALVDIGGIYAPWSNTAALGWLLLSTAGLYGGGVVMNDVFDAELDRRERPERPIPSGQVSERTATLLGIGLLLLGVAAAAQAGPRSAIVAFAVGGLAVLYDAYGKHHSWLGPVNMGACRGGNLLLGMSVFSIPALGWSLALIPLLYISAITLISRGEVEGASNRKPLYLGLAAYSTVILAILSLMICSRSSWLGSLPFIILFCYLIFPPLVRAIETPTAARIGAAVRAGVLALIAMNAAIAAAIAGGLTGLLVLALLPLSLLLARFFAVT